MLQLLATAILTLTGAEGPFAGLDYDAALAQAKAKSKLLFVDFTASWCPPCKRMEAEVWPHADVRAWLGEHAIAIQVDVDEESELAKRFEIQAMPTVVVLREGAEFDRIVGYKDVPAFLAWARDVAAGKRSSDALLERAKALEKSDDVGARYELAGELMRAKQYDLALAHYLWLWPATRNAPEMRGVRATFMLSDMAALAKKHEPARKAFLELLEALQTKLDAPGVPEQKDWADWSAMCGRFGQGQRVLAWYEQRCDAEGRLFAERTGEPAVDYLVAEVFDALMGADRPRDAVRLFVDARKRAQGIVTRYEQMMSGSAGLDEESRSSLEEHAHRSLTNDIAELYAALLSADRGDEAGDVGAMLIRTLDTPQSRLALVRAGLGVSRSHASLLRWLGEAEAAGENVKTLRRRLERLAEKDGAAGGGG